MLFDLKKIEKELKTDFISRKIVYNTLVDSTNGLAKANNEEPDGTVFFSEEQQAGKGRFKRTWECEKECGLLMSILLKPDMQSDKISALALLAGLCVCRVLNRISGISCSLKWPNDVIVNSKKIAGILCESAFANSKIKYTVLGIGINVLQEKFPQNLSGKATSVYRELNKKCSREDIYISFMNEFEKAYKTYLEKGFSAFKEEYLKYCITLNKEVYIFENGIEKKVYSSGISEEGNLIVSDGQETKELTSGEISVRGILGYI